MRDMSQPITRRAALKQISAAGAGVLVSRGVIRGQGGDIVVGGQPVEIAVASLSPSTVRISVLPIVGSTPTVVPQDGGLAEPSAAKRVAAARASTQFKPVRAGNLTVRFTAAPPTIHIDAANGAGVEGTP